MLFAFSWHYGTTHPCHPLDAISRYATTIPTAESRGLPANGERPAQSLLNASGVRAQNLRGGAEAAGISSGAVRGMFFAGPLLFGDRIDRCKRS